MSMQLRNQRDERRPRREVTPRVDVYNGADDVLVLCELPGVVKEDLTLRVEEAELILEAARKPTEPGAEAERYARRFTLPEGIDRARIAAELEDGVVRVTLPKAETAKPRTIPIT